MTKWPVTRRNLAFAVLGIACVLLILATQGPRLLASLRTNAWSLLALTGKQVLQGQLLTSEFPIECSAGERECSYWAVTARVLGRYDLAEKYWKLQARQPERSLLLSLRLAEVYRLNNQRTLAWEQYREIANATSVLRIRCKAGAIDYPDRSEAAYWCELLAMQPQLSVADKCLLARYWATEGEVSRAAAVFEEAAEGAPDPDCLYRFAQFELAQGKSEAALKLFQEAYAQKGLASYLVGVGQAYAGEGAYDKAIAAFERAYQMAGHGRDCADALGGIASIYYYQLDDLPKAQRFSSEAIQCDSSVDVSTYYVLARSARELRDVAQSVAAYENIELRLRGGTYLLTWRHEYAKYLVSLGRNAEAASVYQRILHDAPSDEAAKSYVAGQ